MFQIETISAKMLDYYVERQDAVLIDLRTPADYREGHVATAVNVPYEQWETFTGFPKDKMLVLYCDRGGASLDVARKLAKKGYEVRSVIGGFLAYQGRHLVKGMR